ncbi:MAG: tol-pal system protein YbgF [Alphaproteobacteria bacterium]|nr:tol-pal system protein YbgF [Alphaproteobacteria bacterium]
MLRLAVAAMLGLSILLTAQPAAAQDSGNLARQVERLRRELADLQRHVYKGGQPPVATTTTPTDGGQPLSPGVGARMQVQITQMQDQVRTMNGRVEEIQHRIALLEQRLDRMSEDLEIRLLAIEDALARGVPAAAATPPGEPATESGGGEVAIAPGVPTELPEGTPREQYDFAYSLLKKHQWIEGRAALQAFLEKNPNDDLSDNASYWLGETYYINKQYKDAAKAFLDGYRNYPKADKAPDNLLKLGKSLAALEQPDKACTTYAKLLEDYPNSLPRIIKLAKSERKKLNCK